MADNLLEKLYAAPEASYHVLDEAKAKRMNALTLYIPSVQDVAKVIREIPYGETRTIIELRQTLAILGNAETACPAKTIKYWKWLASAYDQALMNDESMVIPWWRVLKDDKPSRHMPGGIENHLHMLRLEGHD